MFVLYMIRFLFICFMGYSISISAQEINTCIQQKISKPICDETEFNSYFTYLTNAYRLKNKRSNLTTNERLEKAAQIHNEQMATLHFVAHNNPKVASLKTPKERLEKVQYHYTAYAENIGYAKYNTQINISYKQLLDKIFSSLINSKEHKENILSKEYSEIGCTVSCVIKSNQMEIFVTQVFGKGTMENIEFEN